MIVFADTSALFALLVRDDFMHVRARANFEHFAENGTTLVTSSYVVLETLALLQRRIGMGAVRDFNGRVYPLLEVVWADEGWHTRAVQRLVAEDDRSLSLTDCLSFEIMEARDIETAFSFDDHFVQHGFTIAAFHDLDRR